MLNRNYVALSFYERQVKQSINRTKLLAELESKLILTDVKNNDLTFKVTQLKMENTMLKSQLQRQTDTKMKNKRALNESAIHKANKYLTSKWFGSAQASSESRQPLKVNQTCHNDNSKLSIKKDKLNCTCLPQSHLKLSKAVYFKHEEQPPFLLQTQRGKQDLTHHKREFSFKGQEQGNHLNCIKLSESKGIVQESRQLGSHATQQLQEGQKPLANEQLKRWKSDGNFGNESELLFGSNANNLPKRRTFLSIVSVSSKSKRL